MKEFLAKQALKACGGKFFGDNSILEMPIKFH